MKEIKARVESAGMFAYTVSINDHDAMTAALQRTWTGFSVEEALDNANKKLNLFGYTAVLEK